MNLEQAFQIDLVDFLARLGHKPTKVRGRKYWYLSPYRNERTASFNVNIDKNQWYDHGDGRGGGIIALAKLLFHINDTSEALRRIEEHSCAIPIAFNKPPCVVPEPQPVMENVRIYPLTHQALLDYLSRRGIRQDIARLYCKEVHYELRGNRYFNIGFANNSGGYELRNPYFKGCMGKKDITIIHNSSLTSELDSASCHVFEGFISFLSFLILLLMGKLNIPDYASHDYIILNSVSNVGKVLKILDNYERIFTYLDNDEAGQKATETILGIHGSAVIDMSFFYHPHNDLNDYLCSMIHCSKQKQSI